MDRLTEVIAPVVATPLDVALLLVLLLAVLSGLRSGLLARVASWSGSLGGLLLAGRTVPWVLDLADTIGLSARTFLAVLTIAATVTFTSVAVTAVSAPLRRLLRLGPLSVLDRSAGAFAGGMVVLLILWVVTPTAAAVPGRISVEARASAVLTTIDANTPPPPDVARTLRSLLRGHGFPEVFAALSPTPVPIEEAPGEVPLDGPTLARAVAATTGITAFGCGRRSYGSGFAVSDTLIVTNAHVVAGGRDVEVRDAGGRSRAAEVVVFDKDSDLALLETAGHGLTVLPLRVGDVGEEGAVIGYPGGQVAARVAPARIDRWITALGRDIYGRDATERSLLLLAATLRAGDSGAPLVSTEGEVLGVVFAVSPDVPTAAYALAIEEVLTLLAAPRSPGDAGACQ
jgi:S1-C subfamily serine protease